MCADQLPPPRDGSSTYALSIVCLGNICRSPMAAVVLEHALADAGLANRVSVTSAGTGAWHMGDPMDHRASALLAANGLDPTRHRATRFDRSWFARHDLILAMDAANRRDIDALAPTDEDRSRVWMYRDLDPLASEDLDVPDPWFAGDDGFEVVMEMVNRTSDELVRRLHLMFASGSR